MSTTVRTCPDGHRCDNGSSCAEHPIQEGKYYCDCGTSGGDFAGLFCEYKAETYCELREETTSDWFCTNGGTCVLSTGGGSEAQWDCDCPDKNYEGPHCQFVSGNVPNDWPGFDFDPVTGTMTNAKHSKRRSGGGAAGIIHFGIYIFIGLVVAALLALMGLFVMRKIRNRRGEIGDAKQNATRDHSEAVNKLEADGSVLHGALAQFARAPNATLQQQQQQQQQEREPFDAASIANGSSDEASVEVGFYTDKPRRNGNGNGNRHGHHASRDIL